MSRSGNRTALAAWLTLGSLVACSTPKDKNSAPREVPLAEEAATKGNVPPPAVDVIREAARRPQPRDAALLRRSLVPRGPARLWAAFGLGKLCRTDRAAITSALGVALGAWALDTEPPTSLEVRALTRALGACGTSEAEALLRSWVSPTRPLHLPDLSVHAAVALGALADELGKLEERTWTTLLDAAEREKNPTLLYALGRSSGLGEALAARTLDVAGELITRGPHPGRRHALLALGSAGASAALPLRQVVLSADFPGVERALAVSVLHRLGPAGRDALDPLLTELLGRGLPEKPDDELWLVLGALVKHLEQPRAARQGLMEIPFAPLPPGERPEDVALRRRRVLLRCRAADLVAVLNEKSPALAACDPAHGRPEKEALLRVLDRGKLTGKRAASFDELLASSDPVVQQAALRLLPAHAEYEKTREALVTALGHANAGTRATAFSILASHPHKALTDEKEPAADPRILSAIQAALAPSKEPRPLETTAAALSAAGALRALTLKPAVESLCDGPEFSLHARASSALGLLGSPGRLCPARLQEAAAPPASAPSTPVTLVIDSDLGALRLVLDTPDTFAARARLVAWVQSGVWKSVAVGSVAPGFGVSFGDPDGDGYDGGGAPPLPEETSPRPFEPMSVSLNSFAPGAATTQLLVTVADAPQLNGEKVLLGRAEGPWHLLVSGDELRNARVEAASTSAPTKPGTPAP